jgi:class 3 adenylate cyclase
MLSMGAVSTITVLFTDLVGSTALSSQVGPSSAEHLRQEHFRLLRSAIVDTGGREVKNLGDGLMVVFESAVAAVDCAVTMQQRLEQRNRRSDQLLSVRIGLAHGDADCADDDYFGPPVVEAARLCAKAQGGQILCAELLSVMTRGRGGHRFEAIGSLELKGLPEPVRAFEVSWQPLLTSAGIPLPPALRGIPPVGYVGRERERSSLGRLFKEAGRGAFRLALLAGEPGIGKTRLATFAALKAHGDGAVVLYGRCEEGLAVPYGPWVDALRHCVATAEQSALAGFVDQYGTDLVRLVPELARRIPDLAPPTETDAETERYMVFGAVAGLLERFSGDVPVVIVLDDLHWADKGTLLLLRHLAHVSASVPLLIIASYRGSEITRRHPLAEALADLRLQPGVERIDLAGLEEQDVIDLMEAAAGHDLPPEGLALAAEILRETDGNPFFVAELMRHLSESGAVVQLEDGHWRLVAELDRLGLPESVREVIGHRVERLDADAAVVLRAAAAIGRDFELTLLARVVDRSEDDLLDLLEAAVEAALIVESSEDAGRFGFAHALINHTLYEELGATRRARTHRRIAEVLEESCGSDPGDRIGELARHWALATEPAQADKAIDYARRAGERARAAVAPDEAVRWFSQALELLDGQSEPDAALRCELLICLGDASREAGDPGYREMLLEAAQLALDRDDRERLARAVVANNRGRTSVYGDVDQERVALLEAAARLTDDSAAARRSRVLSVLALELVFDADYERRRELSDEALELARRAGDDRNLAQVLRDRLFTIWAPGTLEERRANAAELMSLAQIRDDPVLRYWAHHNMVEVRAESGDIDGVREGLSEASAIARQLGQPTLQWVAAAHECCLTVLTGSIDELQRDVDAAMATGAASGEPDALLIGGAQIAGVYWYSARWDELLALLEGAARELPRIPAFHGAYGAALFEAGREHEARIVLDEAKARGLAGLPRDAVTSAALAFYSILTHWLADEDAAAVLSEQLAEAGTAVAWMGGGSYGASDVYRGILAEVLGRAGEARARLEAGIELNDRMGAKLWAIRARLYLAELLATADDSRDRKSASELFEQARTAAIAENTPALIQRAEAGLAAVARA